MRMIVWVRDFQSSLDDRRTIIIIIIIIVIIIKTYGRQINNVYYIIMYTNNVVRWLRGLI